MLYVPPTIKKYSANKNNMCIFGFVVKMNSPKFSLCFCNGDNVILNTNL